MRRKYIFIAIMLGLFVAGAKYFDHSSKKNKGYCFAENRYLSNDEILHTAVGSLLSNLSLEYANLSEQEKAERIVYSDVETFLKKQPGCCGLSHNQGKSKLPQRPVKAWIKDRFIHTIIYQYKNDAKAKYRRVRFATSFCADDTYSLPYSDKDKWNTGSVIEKAPFIHNK